MYTYGLFIHIELEYFWLCGNSVLGLLQKLNSDICFLLVNTLANIIVITTVTGAVRNEQH